MNIEIEVIEARWEERISIYKQIIESSKAQGLNTIVCVPNKYLVGEMSKLGISAITPKDLYCVSDQIAGVIVEQESSGYREVKYPHMDLRVYIRYWAEAHEAKLYFGDSLVSLESKHLCKSS